VSTRPFTSERVRIIGRTCDPAYREIFLAIADELDRKDAQIGELKRQLGVHVLADAVADGELEVETCAELTTDPKRRRP
jgi:hypothetical protein